MRKLTSFDICELLLVVIILLTLAILFIPPAPIP
jgi:hypothetical protein